MEKEDIELLVNQIRNILLNKPIHDHMMSRDKDLESLQEAVSYLANCISESNEFLRHLIQGKLDVATPSRHNFMAGNLKELHSILRHLTWQAEQVANGDYTQHVDYLGDFSEAFNKMIAQLAEREQKIKEQTEILKDNAYIDELTGIYNRRYYQECISTLLKKQNHFSICMIDLDHLKYVNDYLGHAKGDEYIKTATKEIRESIRGDDIFCRIGGDEFIIIFSSGKESGIWEKMNDVKERLEKSAKDYEMTFSYGIAEYTPDCNLTVTEVIEQADQRMYQQKKRKKQGY